MPCEQEPYYTFNLLHCALLSVSYSPASSCRRKSLSKTSCFKGLSNFICKEKKVGFVIGLLLN